MDITVKETDCLVKIIESGSFSAAANELNLSQPTISNHISNLEQKLNLKLLDRKKDGVRPTAAGKVVYKTGKALREKIKNMHTDIASLRNLKTGELKIGGSTIPGTYILPAAIGEFKRKFPGIKVDLDIGDSRKIIKDLGAGKTDLAVVGYKPPSIFFSKEAAHDRIIIAVPGKDKWAGQKTVSPSKLLSRPLIMRERGSATRKVFLEKLRKKTSRALKTAVIAGSSEAVKKSVLAGIGPGIISSIAVREELKEGLLKELRLQNISLKRNFYLVLKNFPPQSIAAKEFISLFDAEEKN